MKTFIYALIDPITEEVRYIGKSNNPKKRFSGHVVDKNKTYKTMWIRSLKKQNLSPILEIIDSVSFFEWEFWEQHYISLYRSWGFRLTNLSNGGFGGINGKRSDETKMKMRNAQLGKRHSFETKEKLRQINLGNLHSEETKEKNRQSNLGRKQSPAAITKTAAANRGRKNTEECKQRISKKLKGRKVPKDVLERRAKAQSKPIIQFDLEGNKIKEYPSVVSAKNDISPKNNGLSDCLKGKTKTWCGYKWKYKINN